jgi:hypothetical protein
VALAEAVIALLALAYGNGRLWLLEIPR